MCAFFQHKVSQTKRNQSTKHRLRVQTFVFLQVAYLGLTLVSDDGFLIRRYGDPVGFHCRCLEAPSRSRNTLTL